jgi:hypothetical protein
MKKPSIELTVGISTLLGIAAAMSAPALADTSKTTETTTTAKGELPFFARFVEGQKSPSERIALTNERRGETEKKDRVTTRKFPSDAEDNSGGGVVTTQKFPSDGEDNSGGNPTTAKFPSDNEDNSGGSVGVTNKFPSDAEDNSGGGIGVTKKYPSDSEDNSGGGIVRPRR